jgi:hypothetical protein
MMKKVILGALILSPALALAQGGQPLGNIMEIIEAIGEIITMVIPFAFALILLFFFWGLATYVFASGNTEVKEAAKTKMLGGILALFVASAIWGLTAFLGNAIGVDTDITNQDVPTIGN